MSETAPPAAPPASGRAGRGLRAAILLLFLLGLAARSVIFTREHHEGDEVVYDALVAQLASGRGYTLQGHPILEQPWIDPAQHGQKLFFHPPGGILLFLGAGSLLGRFGYGTVELLAYAVFFWSVLAFARAVASPLGAPETLALAGLAAFTPIMTHVTSRYWFDGPLLAFSTAALALFVSGIGRGSTRRVVAAALLLGAASWIKITALIVLPGACAVAWAVSDGAAERAGLARRCALFAAVALLVQLPWEIWQWAVLGSPIPAWAGRPSPKLIEVSRYVHMVTVVRSPWIYLGGIPRILWTLVPSLLLLGAQWNDPRLRRRGGALAAWVVFIVGLHIALGTIGYSKVMRYVILITPATVALFVLTVAGARRKLAGGGSFPGGRTAIGLLLLVAAAGLLLEIAQGIKTPLVDNHDLIQPLLR